MSSSLVLVLACARLANDSAPDRDAVLLEHPAPVLPRTELGTQILPPMAGVECRVDVVVGADGSVRRVAPLRSPSCSPSFARAAQTHALEWRFFPAQHDGTAVPTRRVLTVRFDRDLLQPD